MLLTEQQLRFFETFGYLALRGLFRDEVDALNDAFRDVWTANGGGLDGAADDLDERLTIVVPFVDQHPYLSSLIDDPRIHGIGVFDLRRGFQLHDERRQRLQRRYALALGLQPRGQALHQDRVLLGSAGTSRRAACG